jgi:hypothetical protein
VWALQYLPCGTLVSGSSDGDVTFWDGEHATKISAHRQHKADVLALASSPDGASVFASGVDSQIAVFEKASIDGDGVRAYKWTFTGTKRPHTHDVRALAMAAAPPSEQSDKSGKSDCGERRAQGRGGFALRGKRRATVSVPGGEIPEEAPGARRERAAEDADRDDRRRAVDRRARRSERRRQEAQRQEARGG